MWKTLGLAALLVVIAVMFWTWQHFELMRHGYRLEELQRQQAAEEDVARHLRLEIETPPVAEAHRGARARSPEPRDADA